MSQPGSPGRTFGVTHANPTPPRALGQPVHRAPPSTEPWNFGTLRGTFLPDFTGQHCKEDLQPPDQCQRHKSRQCTSSRPNTTNLHPTLEARKPKSTTALHCAALHCTVQHLFVLSFAVAAYYLWLAHTPPSKDHSAARVNQSPESR